MNAVIPFAFEDSLVRALWRAGDPWFVAKDVCGALGLMNVSDATEKLDDDEKDRASIPTLGGPQDLLIVSEGGLYSIVLRCRDAMKPGTVPHRFRRWVTGEVLPTLRRTGRYAMPGASGYDHNGPTLSGQDTEYRRRLDTVSEARRLYGPARARLLYERLGLPEVPELPPDAPPECMDAAGMPFDPEAAIAAVRTFIQENRDTRFVPVRQAGADRTWTRRHLAGFVTARGDFLFLDEGWREATAGLDARAAAGALAEAGYLLKSPAGERKRAERVRDKTMRVYRVAGAIISESAP